MEAGHYAGSGTACYGNLRNNGKPNVLTIAWTGIVNSEPPMTYISVRPSRYSHNIIKESGEFVINVTTLELAKACDYCGVKSGKNTDKIKEMNLEIEACKKWRRQC